MNLSRENFSVEIESEEFGTHILEYIDSDHLYLVDGMVVQSVTQAVDFHFNDTYKFVDEAVLKKAAAHGTAVHKAVEDYCDFRIESELPELQDFKKLQEKHGFIPEQSEVPIIIFNPDTKEPILAGRFDLMIRMNDELGGADIKSQRRVKKDKLEYQLNLYRIGYKQCYNDDWKFLKGIQLKTTEKFHVARMIDVPIDEEMTWNRLNLYLEAKHNG